MSLLTRMRIHDAVYWAPASFDGYDETLGSPVQVKCRWDEISEEYLNVADEKVVSKAVIYPNMTPEYGGYFWKGALSGVPSGDPKSFAERIGGIQVVTKIRNADFENYDKTLVTVFV